MRHRVKGRKLNRTASHRIATFRALATALLREKKIRTTIAKAKELRSFVEPLISRAKTDSVANRRNVARYIQDKEILKELFNEIVPKIGDRPGGYTRVVKLGRRQGDGAEMAIIELVDYNDVNSKPQVPKAETKEEIIEDANVVEETVAEKTEVTDDAKVEETKSEDVKEETTEEVKAEEVIEDANVVEETVVEKTETTATESKDEAEVKEESTEEVKAEEASETKEEDKKEDK